MRVWPAVGVVERHLAAIGETRGSTAPDGSEHRTGVWTVNQKQRRDRLDPGQLRALAELGIDRAREKACLASPAVISQAVL